jgi:hypothetical protein
MRAPMQTQPTKFVPAGFKRWFYFFASMRLSIISEIHP